MNRVCLLAALLVQAGLVACGSQTTPSMMMPSPIVMQDERLDFARIVQPENRRTEVSVLFATTRVPAPPESAERFTRNATNAVRLGVAQVQLGEPGWSFDELSKSDRTSGLEEQRPARVVAVKEFGIVGGPESDADRDFIAAVDRQVATSLSGSVVIYVPGYRTTFDQVMVLMGSWAHFLGASRRDRLFLADRHLDVELLDRLPTGTRIRSRHCAADRARRRTQQGTTPQLGRFQLRLAAARGGARGATPRASG